MAVSDWLKDQNPVALKIKLGELVMKLNLRGKEDATQELLETFMALNLIPYLLTGKTEMKYKVIHVKVLENYYPIHSESKKIPTINDVVIGYLWQNHFLIVA
jgi:hypothetical protein